MDTINLLLENIDLILTTLTSIVVIASLIVAGTKTPDPDSKLGKIYKLIEFLAIVVGKAKDEGKPKDKG